MDFSAIRIEMVAALIALGLLAFGLLIPRGRRDMTGSLAALAFLGLLALTFLAPGQGASFSGGRYLNDSLSLFFKQVFIARGVPRVPDVAAVHLQPHGVPQ